MTKVELRQLLTPQLRALAGSSPARHTASQAICRAIEQQPCWPRARRVCAFLPLPGEPRITPLWEGKHERTFCFPRIRNGTIDLILLEDPELLRRATWRLDGPEFDAAAVVPPGRVDLFLVPGVAFTSDGRRLGRGAGYYDRLLANRAPQSAALGVCFALQLVEDLPFEPHDQNVDAVVTERSADPR
ncbi:MAG: 5-formyltetrahydrofolate cyclo-ligase [Chthoniobacter sp.]|nr:5-formyltetrahydrofolate cyclo-ligase [Chthoniobacter sp.]